MKKETASALEHLNTMFTNGVKLTYQGNNGFKCLYLHKNGSCQKMLESFKTEKELLKAIYLMQTTIGLINW